MKRTAIVLSNAEYVSTNAPIQKIVVHGDGPDDINAGDPKMARRRSGWSRWVVALCVAPLLTMTLAGSAHAYTVDSKDPGVDNSDCAKVKPDIEICTFEQALELANRDPDGATIDFHLKNLVYGQQQAVAAPQFVRLSKPIRIDGSTQDVPGLPPNVPPIDLGATSFDIYGKGSMLRGLAFMGEGKPFPNARAFAAVVIQPSAESVTIDRNWIGFHWYIDQGSGAPSGTTNLIACNRCQDLTIGGDDPEERNVLSGSRQHGVSIDGGSEIRVGRNYVGLGPDGTTPLGNGLDADSLHHSLDGSLDGIFIKNSSAVSVTGNVISASGHVTLSPHADPMLGSGVSVFDSSALFESNRIGTNAAGTEAVPNKGHGISVEKYGDTRFLELTIGRPGGKGNLISGNGGAAPESGRAISLQLGEQGRTIADRVIVQSNLIGTKADGTGAMGNRNDGVHVSGTSDQVTVGGSAPSTGNVIANSTKGSGVQLRNAGYSGSVAVLGNSIYDNAGEDTSLRSNSGLGIALGGAGWPIHPTPNDDQSFPYDTDSGENGRQNFPRLELAATSETETTVSGELRSQVGIYRIEVFSSPTCDARGHGEGKTFLGAFEGTTDHSGVVGFTARLSKAVPAGDTAITATATTATNTAEVGKTSEFSPCVAPTRGETPPPDTTPPTPPPGTILPAPRPGTMPPTGPPLAWTSTSSESLRVSKSGRFNYSFVATPLRSGKISLKSTKKVRIGSKPGFMKLAAKDFTAASTGGAKVKFKLSSKHLKALKRVKKLRFKVKTMLDGRTFTTKLALKAPKKT